MGKCLVGQVFGPALEDQVSSCYTAFETQIDDPIGRVNDMAMMRDNPDPCSTLIAVMSSS